MRYPLVDGQGNFGSVDGDPPAAMRYTEARMALPAMDIMADIQRDTVDYTKNFDESMEEPVFQMTVDEVGGPFQTEAGFHVLKILEIKDSQVVPFWQARPTIVERLAANRQREVFVQWSERLKERCQALIDDDGVRVAAIWAEQDIDEFEAELDSVGKGASDQSPSPHAGPGASNPITTVDKKGSH